MTTPAHTRAVAEVRAAEELAALPVGTVVECCWLTREDTSRPFGEMTKPVTRLFMVTEHMLVAERYEVDKRGPYGALIRFPGGIRVVSRPDTAGLLAYPAHAEWGVRYGDDSGASPAFVTTNQRRAEQDAAEWSHYTGQPTAIFRRQVTDWKEAER